MILRETQNQNDADDANDAESGIWYRDIPKTASLARVINGFMIQGGGFEPGMKQKETKSPIQNEANNGLKNTRGTLAMARTQAPHSATAQFFINVADNDFLNFSGESLQGWGYCVFAEVVEGMDVVDKIKAVATGRSGMHQDVPKDDVIIKSVTVSE